MRARAKWWMSMASVSGEARCDCSNKSRAIAGQSKVVLQKRTIPVLAVICDVISAGDLKEDLADGAVLYARPPPAMAERAAPCSGKFLMNCS